MTTRIFKAALLLFVFALTSQLNAQITLTISNDTSICSPTGSATLTVNASGGTPGYYYSWTPSSDLDDPTAATVVATPTSTTTYTVEVTDQFAVQATATVLVTVNSVTAYASSNSPLCEASAINLFGTGGISFSWSGPNGYSSTLQTPSIPNATVNDAGMYTLTVTDAFGCTASDMVFVNVDPLPYVTISSSDVTCFGLCDGSATANVAGTAPFTYSWSLGGIQLQTISGLCGNQNYTVTVTDAVGCAATAWTPITEPTQLTATSTSTATTCYKSEDGTLDVNATGGTPPYWYYWSCGTTSQTVPGIAGGVYTYTVQDANNCQINGTETVNQPAQIYVSFSVTQSTCGNSDGSLFSTVTGGVGPYTYFWPDASSGTSLVSIPSGQYFLNITDANGCSVTALGTIDDSNGPLITLDQIDTVTCPGLSNGAVYTTISGGLAPYDIMWMNGAISDDNLNLAAGVYDVTVTDANGCQVIRSYTVPEPDPFGYYSTSTPPTACGTADGDATFLLGGGTTPYSYLWDANAGNQTTQTATGLAAGLYKVIFTDAKGCTDSAFVTIEDSNAPYINTDSIFDADCSGAIASTGAIYISVYGGSGTYNIEWMNGATTEDMVGVTKGHYAVEAEDAATGCKTATAHNIYGIMPGTPQLCLVTVDTATNHNIIYWENVPGIADYKIYRETSTPGQFILIATIPADSASEFEDTLANAGIKPWDYEIKVTDSCGFVSSLSINHQSIYLTVSQMTAGTANLAWTPYSGTSFNQYYIYRKDSTNPWTLLDSVASSVLAYVDNNVPSDSVEYLIEIVPNSPCDVSRALINTSRSNIKQIAATPATGIAEAEMLDVSVAPNPFNDQAVFTIASKSAKVDAVFELYDETGRIVKRSNVSSQKYILEKGDLSAGIYFYTVRDKSSGITGKGKLVIGNR